MGSRPRRVLRGNPRPRCTAAGLRGCSQCPRTRIPRRPRRRPALRRRGSSSGGPSGGGAGCRRPPCRRRTSGRPSGGPLRAGLRRPRRLPKGRNARRGSAAARTARPTSAGFRPGGCCARSSAPAGPFRGCRAPRAAAPRVPCGALRRTVCPREGVGAPGRNGVRGLPGLSTAVRPAGCGIPRDGRC